MTLQTRYRHVVLSFVGLLTWLALFDTRVADLSDLNSLLPLVLLSVPIASLGKAALHRIERPADLGPTALTVIGLGMLLLAHRAALA
ncbi:hypothetical protein [Duganella vulcania]|uniref:Uncharacterized protein n=1 Tax=Duganella vulcania TaxID=2692166 RepID=A0A845GIC5_9BURK|nr:hypothetical protein [Duganella vulcania]MYM92808.1 hypothetical protein [Duganella vulcania]